MYSKWKYFKTLVLYSGPITTAMKTKTLEIKGISHIIGKLSMGMEFTLKTVLYV